MGILGETLALIAVASTRGTLTTISLWGAKILSVSGEG